VLLSEACSRALTRAGVDRHVRGRLLNASDHAPVWVELSKRSGRRGGHITAPSDRGTNSFWP
jgi:hypothetical protein